MEHPGRPGPQRHRGAGLLLLIVAMGLLAALTAPLRSVLGVRRNLEALVVTAAPPPGASAPVLPLLALPTVAPPRTGVPNPATVLVLGVDRRPGEATTPRSDAVLVVRLDPANGRVAVLSLPRDLWVTIPGHGRNRLNAAYLWGERDGPAGGGMALSRATVAGLLGMPIDYVVVADFRGFVALVDAIGGVTVDVERPLVDTRFPTADRRTTTVRFAAGPQRMDGVAALTYARIRHPDSDFERGRRQQAVLIAIVERLREQGSLETMRAAERLSAALVGYVQTDMPTARMLELAWALRELDSSAVERYALAEGDVSFGVDNDRFAQMPRPGVIERVTRLLLGGEEQQGSSGRPP